jgi:hypothetical protein
MLLIRSRRSGVGSRGDVASDEITISESDGAVVDSMPFSFGSGKIIAQLYRN